LSVLELLEFARRHFWRLALWALGLAVAGYLVCFVIPPTYRATAVILPPEEDELTSALAMSRRSMIGLGALGRLGSYVTQADVALAILKSRSVRERLVEEFDLRHVYKVKTQEQAVKALEERSRTRLSSDGTISVAIADVNAKRAAAIANAGIAELDRLSQWFRSSRARRTREFLEHRVAQADSSLRLAERELALYQQKKGSIVISSEMRGAMSAAADLMARKAAAEVQLELMRDYASAQNEEFQRLEATIRELRRQVRPPGHGPAGGLRCPHLPARAGEDPRDHGHADDPGPRSGPAAG
jgi:tyrosine-protein kinase Etk/Wzc